MVTAKPSLIFSNWNTMIEGLDASPQEFFSQVEKSIEERELPNAKMSRVDWKEGGVFSAKREYLRVRRKQYTFDICGAPFGNGFFVSWWLGEVPSGFWRLISFIPIFGPLLQKLIKPLTYYEIDTRVMYQSLVHSAVLEVIDNMTDTKGVRKVPELERKPIMRDIFQK